MLARITYTFTSTRWLFVLALSGLVMAGAAEPGKAQNRSHIYEPRVPATPDGSLRIIVPGTPEEIARISSRYGVDVKRQLKQGGALQVTREQLEALTQDGTIGPIAADAVVEATMSVSTVAIGADQLWPGPNRTDGTAGSGVGIAILDSGIGSHPDLEGRVVVSVDFVDPDGEGDDEYGHDTHVAGIAAGSGAAGGVAPAAHLVNLRVLNDEGWGHASTVIDAIEWTIANKGPVRDPRPEPVARCRRYRVIPGRSPRAGGGAGRCCRPRRCVLRR